MIRVHFLYLSALLLAVCVILAACDSGSSDDPGPNEDFDRAALLENVATNLILPAYQSFQASVTALHQASDEFVASPSAATLTALQGQLKAARLAWQDVALFQFGPAETFALRGALNTYPADTDQVEANIASENYVLGSLDNLDAGGFPAFEYLAHGSDQTVDEVVALFTTDPGAAQRAAYLEDNMDFIQSTVDAVVGQWDPSTGDYLATFLSNERGGVDVGSSLGQLINAFILHYERYVRDGKIGIPVGVRSSGIARPKATEAYYGGYSVELAVASTEAMRRLYEGTGMNGSNGVGLRENLEALEAASLASDISLAFDDVIGLLEGLSDPLGAQIESDMARVLSAFTEMQGLVVLLKADMTSFLGVTITFQDNDGD